jgi:tetratricopeptide (TPR) repeat protein
MLRTRFVGGVLAMLVLPVLANAQLGDSWVGKKVMMTRPGIQLKGATDKGEPLVEAAATMVYTVLDEVDGWIKVRQEASEGWFLKGDGVLLQHAVALFTEQIKANPNDARAHACRAAAHDEMGQFDAGIKDLDEAIRLQPNVAEYRSNRGGAYAQKKDFDKALEDFAEAIRLNPNLAGAYYNRGHVYSDKKELVKAIQDYTEALRIDPKYVSAYNNRGAGYRDLKQYDKAIDDYNEALRLSPKDGTVYSNRGLAYAGKKEYAKALADYAAAAKLEPNNVMVHNNAAWLLATCPKDEVRDGKKAIQYAKKACELTGWKEAFYKDTLAAAYAEDGQFDLAVKYQREALKSPSFVQVYGVDAQQRLKYFEMKKPWREE